MSRAPLITIVLLLALLPQPACGPFGAPQKSSPSSTPQPEGGTHDQPTRDQPGRTQTTETGPTKKVLPLPPLPPVLGPVQHGAIGIFSYDSRTFNANPVIRYKKNVAVVTREEFIALLVKADQEGRDFRELVNKSIADLPVPVGKVGYQLQSPLINAASKNDPFYWVAYEDAALGHGGGVQFVNYLMHCNPAPLGAHAGADYISRFHRLYAADNNAIPNFIDIGLNDPLGRGPQSEGAVIFKGGYGAAKADEIMVSPCTLAGNLADAANVALGHIYSFAKETDVNPAINPGKWKLAQSFWHAVGMAAHSMFDGTNVWDLDHHAKTELYLSAHGHGIRYLHLRLENAPLYYNQIADLRDEALSRNLYTKFAFP